MMDDLVQVGYGLWLDSEGREFWDDTPMPANLGATYPFSDPREGRLETIRSLKGTRERELT